MHGLGREPWLIRVRIAMGCAQEASGSACKVSNFRIASISKPNSRPQWKLGRCRRPSHAGSTTDGLSHSGPKMGQFILSAPERAEACSPAICAAALNEQEAQGQRRATEMDVAVQVMNRMLELGRPTYVRIA